MLGIRHDYDLCLRYLRQTNFFFNMQKGMTNGECLIYESKSKTNLQLIRAKSFSKFYTKKIRCGDFITTNIVNTVTNFSY